MVSSPTDYTTKRVVIEGLEDLVQREEKHCLYKFVKSVRQLARTSHTAFLVLFNPCALSDDSCALGVLRGLFDIVLVFSLLHSTDFVN